MEVILRNAVDKLGHPGDIVSVSAGFARNFLIPRGFAFEATTGNRKRISLEKGRLEVLEAERVAAAQTIADWKLAAVIDDNQMACEDLKIADLNGDGRPDLIASGRSTKNVIIYWNETVARAQP